MCNKYYLLIDEEKSVVGGFNNLEVLKYRERVLMKKFKDKKYKCIVIDLEEYL